MGAKLSEQLPLDTVATERNAKKKQKDELRREKRHAKSEDKQVAEPSPKQETPANEESADRAHKKEKRHKHKHHRADELDGQDHKLQIEAEKARARVDALDRLKEQEDEEKAKLKEIAHMAQDRENGDRKSLGAPSSPNGESKPTRAEKKRKRDDAKLHDTALDRIMERELGPSITAADENIETESEKKRKKKEAKRAAKRKREAGEDAAEELPADTMSVDTDVKAEKKKKKQKVKRNSDDEEHEAPEKEKKAKKDKKRKKDHATGEVETPEVADADKVPKEKDKKRKRDQADPATGDNEVTELANVGMVSKDKKEKKKRKDRNEPATGEIETTQLADVDKTKDKKDKKKKKKGPTEPTASGDETTKLVEVDEAAKEKKDEKKKKEKKPAENDLPTPTPPSVSKANTNTNGGNHWNVSALEGDNERRAKFLRLLGGKKAGNSAPNDVRTALASSKNEIAKIQTDLERQFDVGMKMKQEGHGHRRGLGA